MRILKRMNSFVMLLDYKGFLLSKTTFDGVDVVYKYRNKVESKIGSKFIKLKSENTEYNTTL